MRVLYCLSFCLAASIAAFAQGNWRNKVDRQLLVEAEAGNAADFLVVLHEQADLSVAANLSTKEEKGRWVYDRLQRTVGKSQPGIWALLDRTGVAFQSFFLVNAIQVNQGDLQLMEQLASLPAVKEIQPDPWTKLDEPMGEPVELQWRNELTWGLEKINAGLVWELGFKGQGVVIGGQDTGYEWGHPALRDRYRGWSGQNVDHRYHWHDAIHEISPFNNDPTPDPSHNPCGLDSPVPCDDHNHGTHTMGTMIGNNHAGLQIGVAPSSRWIGCRNMERGWGRPSTYLECFEWFLAPTDLDDNFPDPTQAPHVINNSWGCPDVEGCHPGNWALMEQAVENLRAAGIVVVASAGNSGSSGCGSILDAPAFFDGVFTVGASDANDKIAGFSSRGPVTADGSRRLKPNVTAPGSAVRSAVRNGRYATMSGTSMAGPHVAGAVAVIISANPQLAGQVDLIESILEQTAMPIPTAESCEDYSGQKSPNPVFGYGRIDLLAAVKKAREIYIAPNFPIRRLGVQVVPNPAQSEAVFRLREWTGPLQLRLTDALGREVRRVFWTEADGLQKSIWVDQLPPGLYFFHLQGQEHRWNGALVVQ